MLRVASICKSRSAWATTPGGLSRPIGASGSCFWLRSLSYWENYTSGSPVSGSSAKTPAEKWLSDKEVTRVKHKGYERDSISDGWDKDRKTGRSRAPDKPKGIGRGAEVDLAQGQRVRARALVDSFPTQPPRPAAKTPVSSASPSRPRAALSSMQAWENTMPSSSSSSELGPRKVPVNVKLPPASVGAGAGVDGTPAPPYVSASASTPASLEKTRPKPKTAFSKNTRSKDMDRRTAGLPGKQGKGQEGTDDFFFKKRRLLKEAAAETGAADPKKDSKYRKVDSLYTKDRETEHVRGFLEINPFICTGCGAPFQAKAEGEPGYLSKVMMAEHRTIAATIKDKQDAIRTVEATGIALDSQAAEDLLTAAGASAELINSVRAMGRKPSKGRATATNSEESTLGGDAEGEGQTAARGTVVASQSTSFTFTAVDPFETVQDGAMSAVASDGVVYDDDDDLAIDEGEVEEEDDLRSLKAVTSSFQQRMVSGASAANAISANQYTDDGADFALQMFQDMHSVGAESYLRKDYPATRKEKEKYINHKKHRAQQLAAILAGGGGGDELTGKEAAEAAAAHLKVCQRCFRLHQYGQVEDTLRPGFSTHELLTAEHFTNLLGVIRETSCVVLCLVDIFDLEGSILKDLKYIAGKNPVLIAANKVDLIPRNVSNVRLTNWIQEEIKFLCGFKSPREKDQERHAEAQDVGWVRHRAATDESGILRRQNIHLISCTNGQGMKPLMDSALAIAKENGQKIYVMGSANVGKSSFINQLLETSYTDDAGKGKGKKKPTRTNVPLATVSNLPGTTLNFIKIHIPTHAGITVYDTPGLLNTGQLTTKLNPEELRQVIPTTPILPTTIRVLQGKTVLIGGLAQVELLEVSASHHSVFVDQVCVILHICVCVCVCVCIANDDFRPKHSSSDTFEDNFTIFDLI